MTEKAPSSGDTIEVYPGSTPKAAISRWERGIVRAAQVVVFPVAGPAWMIEWVASRVGCDLYFGILSSIPYFLCVTAIATAVAIASVSLVAGASALPVLWIAELIALAVSVATGLRPGNRFDMLLHLIARRRLPVDRSRPIHRTVAGCVIALGFTVWVFAVTYYVLAKHDAGQIGGLDVSSSPLAMLWATLYLSATTITTAGSAYTLEGNLVQMLSLAEISIGLVYFVFVLAVVVARASEPTVTPLP